MYKNYHCRTKDVHASDHDFAEGKVSNLDIEDQDEEICELYRMCNINY